MTTVRIPGSGFHIFAPEGQTVSTVMGFAYGRSLPELPGDPNARTPSMSNPAARAMSRALMLGPGHMEHDFFAHANTGITLIASRAALYEDGEGRGVELTIEEGEGIVDGGHTHSIIRSHLGFLTNSSLQVSLRVVVGELSAEEKVAISRGRNTSKAVRPVSIFNLRGGFSALKKHLKPFASDIAYQENGTGAESAVGVVRSVLCLLGIHPGTHVASAYHSNAGVILNLLARPEVKEKVESFSSMAPLLALRDTIRRDLHLVVPGASNYPRVFTRAKKKLVFLGEESRQVATASWTLPILAGMASLLTETGAWSPPQVEKAERLWSARSEVVGHVIARYLTRGADAALKDPAFWQDIQDALAPGVRS